MNSRESGQVTVFAALMLIVFVGVAAFCMNAAYAFHQHTQMQAKVDNSVLYATGTGCPTSTGSMKIQSPPGFGPYASDTHYCGGTYTLPGTSLFGKIVPAWFPISVQAVARHGGSTEPYFAMLGLSPTGINGTGGCSINFQSASMTSTISGNAYSDSSSGFSSCGGATRNISFTNPYTYTGNSTFYDPFQINMPTSGSTSITSCSSLSSSSCHMQQGCFSSLSVPSTADNYYQSDSSGIAEITTAIGDNNKKDVYLPYCSGSSVMPTLYIVDGNGGKAVTDNSSSNTYVVNATMAIKPGLSIQTNGAMSLTSPTTGSYAGYAMYQESAVPCSSPVAADFKGTPFLLDGLLDLACSDLTFSGSGGYSLKGSVVGYTINFTGSSGGSDVFLPPDTFPPRGSFLVQ